MEVLRDLTRMKTRRQDDSSRCYRPRLKRCFLALLFSPFVLVLTYSLFKTQVDVILFRKQTLVDPHDIVDSSNVATLYRNTTSQIKPAAAENSTTSDQSLMPLVTEEYPIVNTNTSSTDDVPTAVIVLTYMRSGSSLTGDILQQSKDSFYVFEPLKNGDHINQRKEPIHFINGTTLQHSEYKIDHVYEEALYGWLTCDLSRVYTMSLLDFGFMSFGRKFWNYKKCLQRVNVGQLIKTHTFNESVPFMKCLSDFQQVCKNSKFRIIKTIRSKMDIAYSVLKRISNSKVIHLIRDPRATVESQRHRGRCKDGMTRCIAEQCDNVRQDTAVKQAIKPPIRDRIMDVLYEDIASRPIVTSQKMYSFIGMDFTETIANYVFNITLGKNQGLCSVCTARWQVGHSHKSSETHIAAWKSNLPGVYINQTQIICRDIIKHYGFEYYMAPPQKVVTPKNRASFNMLSKLEKKYEEYKVDINKDNT